MNKPLTISIKETREELAKVCNKSGLPPIILDLIMQSLCSEIHIIVERQTIEEEKIYTNAIKNNDIKNEDCTLGDVDEGK